MAERLDGNSFEDAEKYFIYIDFYGFVSGLPP